MSFLKQEVRSPKDALTALRGRRSSKPAKPGRAPALSGRGGGRSVTGLDIEAGYVAAVETVAGGTRVRRAAAMDLPPDLVRDGEVLDPDGLGALLKDFFSEHGLPTRVRVGLANQRVVMRTVDLPPIEDAKQLASAIRFQAQEHIAMPLDQAVLEHYSLGIVGTADGPRSRVVLVAARKEMVLRLLTALRNAGLRPEGIDLSAFALIRALHRAEDAEAPTAYINVGSSTNLAVARGTLALATRVVPVGLDDLVTDLSERRALTREHSRGWLDYVGLETPIDQLEGQADIIQATREVLEDGVVRLGGEVRTSLDFFGGQANAYAERVLISGPGVGIAGFAQRLGIELGLPTEVRVVDEATAGALAGANPGVFSVAAGLTTVEAPS